MNSTSTNIPSLLTLSTINHNFGTNFAVLICICFQNLRMFFFIHAAGTETVAPLASECIQTDIPFTPGLNFGENRPICFNSNDDVTDNSIASAVCLATGPKTNGKYKEYDVTGHVVKKTGKVFPNDAIPVIISSLIL